MYLKQGYYSPQRFLLCGSLVFFFAISGLIPQVSLAQYKKYVNYSGDLMLGALFPVHKRGSGPEPCGEIQLEDGIQLLEAMLFTLDKINKNDNILPGIRLGVTALDSCDSGTYAMEQSLDFVKGFMCAEENPEEKSKRVVGVIGGQSSSVSMHVAGLLRLWKIPQISYMSTSPQLSNREKFPYFFRTVPSDENEAAAIIDILRYFNWTYVSVVYTDSEYAIHCYEALKEFAANDSICFTTPQRIIRDQFRDSDYDQIIRSIINKGQSIRVIILILEKEYMIHILKAARRLGVANDYVFLGTDGWSSWESVVMGKEDILEGALAIQPLVSHIRGFDDYFTGLTPQHRTLNPWFDEFWEGYFRCKLNSSTEIAGDGRPLCNLDLRIAREDSQLPFLHFVRDTVYAFALAIHNMHAERCHGVPGLCPAMFKINGPDLVHYLWNVTFKDEDENPFRFGTNGDGPIRYTIVNFQRDASGSWLWKRVGDYSMRPEGKFELKIEEDKIRYRASMGKEHYPQSTCTPSTTCSIHQVKVREREDTCCWQCRDCGNFQIKHDDSHCDECKPGTAPDANFTKCVDLPEQYIDGPFAISAVTISTLGIIIAVFVLAVFCTPKYNETPIIKAAAREISYVLLFGIILSFSTTFFVIAEPSRFSCSIVRFLLGFCPTLCYAAIVTKTNRIARIFHQRSGHSKTKFISPKSQLIIVLILLLPELTLFVIWMIMSPPFPTFTYPERSTKLKICSDLSSYSYLIGFVWPLILIGSCTLYAIQTRKCPGGFNDSKYIAFTNYTVIIIWIAWIPLFLSTLNSLRAVILAVSLSFSALVEMGCLFFPKIYIVLLKPEKNTKEVVMAPNRSSFATLSNSNPLVTHSTANGRHDLGQHLSPDGIFISTTNSINGSSVSDPT